MADATADTSELVLLFLPRAACSILIGSLWAVAAGCPRQERTELLQIAAQVQFELCRSLQVDPLASRDLLVGLPSDLRAQVAEQLTRHVRLRCAP